MATPTGKRTTAPAFQFYPKDFLSSSKVINMTATERGIYITLLCICWLEGGLPDDLQKLSKMAKVPLKQFARIWPNNLQACFSIVRNGRLINQRLDQEREKQKQYRDQQAVNARKSADARQARLNGRSTSAGERRVNSSSSSPISTLQSASKNKNIRAEPPSDSTPVVLTFPVTGGTRTWDLHTSQIDRWVEAFPNLDIHAECRKALAWLEANPTKRKTSRGMPAFCVRWFGNATDRAPSAVSSRPMAGSRTAGNVDALRRFAERKAVS